MDKVRVTILSAMGTRVADAPARFTHLENACTFSNGTRTNQQSSAYVVQAWGHHAASRGSPGNPGPSFITPINPLPNT
jgi:hypothetical protein